MTTHATNGKVLRAVGYARTSGEGQRDNTSIPDQKRDIEALAARNGWRFLRHYIDESKSGAKTVGRDDYQRMVRDAAAGDFDIIAVYKVDRFARDGLDILNTAKALKRDHGVTVIDVAGNFGKNVLTDFIHAGLAEQERLTIMERTTRGKIATAKAGRPLATRPDLLPFGRAWVWDNKKAKLGHFEVDVAKRDALREVAERYIRGESLPVLADLYYPTLQIRHRRLHETLTRASGPTWEQRVTCAELGVDEKISTPVPALLDDATIKAVLARAGINRSCRKGERAAAPFLLARVVRCAHCGLAMSAQKIKSGRRYYRHACYSWRGDGEGKPRRVPVRCKRAGVKAWVDAAELEAAVLDALFDTFGNPLGVQRAVEAALPAADKAEGLYAELARAEAALAKVAEAKARVVRSIAKGTLSDDDAAPAMADLREQEAELKARLEALRKDMGDLPTAEQIKTAAHRTAAVFGPHGEEYGDAVLAAKRNYLNHHLEEMTDADKRALVEAVFSGKTGTERNGVYVSWADGVGAGKQHRTWRFRLLGRLAFDLWGRCPATPRDEHMGGPDQAALLAETTGGKCVSKGLWTCPAAGPSAG